MLIWSGLVVFSISASAPSGTAVVVVPKGNGTASKATAWTPVQKIRGVNLGSLFLFEPWVSLDSTSPLLEMRATVLF